MRRNPLGLLTKAVAIAFAAVAIFLMTYQYVYRKVCNTMMQSSVDSTLEYLNRGCNDVDTSASILIPKIISLQKNNKVVLLSGVSSLSHSDYATLIDLKKEISSFFPSSGSFARLLLLFDAESPFICATDFILHDLEAAKKGGILCVDSMDTGDFLDMVRASATSSYVRRMTKGCLAQTTYDTLLSSFMILRLSTQPIGTSYAILQIDIQALFDSLLGDSKLGSSVAVSSNGQWIYGEIENISAAQNQTVFYDDRMHTTYLRVTLSNLGAEVWFQVTDAEAFGQISGFTSLLHVLLAVFFILFLVLFVLISLLLIYPLQRLMKRLQLPGRGTVNQIEGEFMRMTESLSSLRPLLRSTLVHKLLFQDYLTPAERVALRSIPEISTGDEYRVVILGDTSEKTEEVALEIVYRISEALPGALVDTMEQRVFSILLTRSETEGAIRARISSLLETLQGSCADSRFFVGVGLPSRDLFSVRVSFQEAQEAFREGTRSKEERIRFFEKNPVLRRVHCITYSELNNLHRMICSGTAKEACELFEQLVQREFGAEWQFLHDKVTFLQFYSDVRGLILRLSADYDVTPVIRSLIDCPGDMPPAHMLDLLRHALYYAADLVSGSQSHFSDELAATIKLYLKEHYADPNLSLSMLGSLFDMSDSGLSRFFKSNIGKNFSAYLEEIRLNEAETLLVDSDLPVKDIAAIVGYITTTTFYKAFRRNWGISPTTYREQNRVGKKQDAR